MAVRKLALFDFDGTITDRDTMLAFVEHCRGPFRFWLGMVWLLPLFVALRLGLVDRAVAKGLFLRHYLDGWSQEDLERAAQTFADRLESWVRPGARRALQRHAQDGDTVLVVSASLDLWLAPFMQRMGWRCLCTEAEFVEGRFVGTFGPNCNGPEKVRRVEAALDPTSFATVVAYGDSEGDAAMLALADESHYQPFR